MTNDTHLPDYSALIDTETHAFIQRTEAAFPDNAATLNIEQQRALYNAMCREFHAGYPAGVVSNNAHIPGACGWQIPVRHYTPVALKNAESDAHIVYLHGGGFVVGGLESHDDVCAEICKGTSKQLTSVDYRLSPEHKHPSALNDTMAVIEHLNKTYPKPIILCGDSAGANLAAAACHAYRNQRKAKRAAPEIIGQVLIYPGLGGDTTQGSYITHAHAPMLSTQDVHFYSHVRCTDQTNVRDPLFSPLLDDDFGTLPPTIVFSAECDPLCDDGEQYCQRIQLAGGRADWIEERGLVHGYLRARHCVDRSAKSFERIIEAIMCLVERRWPYKT